MAGTSTADPQLIWEAIPAMIHARTFSCTCPSHAHCDLINLVLLQTLLLLPLLTDAATVAATAADSNDNDNDDDGKYQLYVALERGSRPAVVYHN